MARPCSDSEKKSETGISLSRMLTRAEAAEALRVSVGSVDNYIKAGRLRASRLGGPGGAVRIDPLDLASFVDAGKGGV